MRRFDALLLELWRQVQREVDQKFGPSVALLGLYKSPDQDYTKPNKRKPHSLTVQRVNDMRTHCLPEQEASKVCE